MHMTRRCLNVKVIGSMFLRMAEALLKARAEPRKAHAPRRHRPTLRELRELALRADDGRHGPDLGKMSGEELTAFLASARA